MPYMFHNNQQSLSSFVFPEPRILDPSLNKLLMPKAKQLAAADQRVAAVHRLHLEDEGFLFLFFLFWGY